MFDCGMHMIDPQKFPNFSMLPTKDLTSYIDCVVITHFHLDHCGALPALTEIEGYKGPIIMSYPTRAIVPLLIEDFIHVSAETDPEFALTPDMVPKSLENVYVVKLHETCSVNDIKIKCYYAGHVLGAMMFLVSWDGLKVLYKIGRAHV